MLKSFKWNKTSSVPKWTKL